MRGQVNDWICVVPQSFFCKLSGASLRGASGEACRSGERLFPCGEERVCVLTESSVLAICHASMALNIIKTVKATNNITVPATP